MGQLIVNVWWQLRVWFPPSLPEQRVPWPYCVHTAGAWPPAGCWYLILQTATIEPPVRANGTIQYITAVVWYCLSHDKPAGDTSEPTPNCMCLPDDHTHSGPDGHNTMLTDIISLHGSYTFSIDKVPPKPHVGSHDTCSSRAQVPTIVGKWFWPDSSRLTIKCDLLNCSWGCNVAND